MTVAPCVNNCTDRVDTRAATYQDGGTWVAVRLAISRAVRKRILMSLQAAFNFSM